VSWLTYTSGTTLNLRLQAFGTSPTTVRAKVLAAESAEPTAWTSSATGSLVTRFDNYVVTAVP